MNINVVQGDHRVLRRIQNAIITGEFTPGQSLSPALLSEILLVSPAPIRDALSRLSERGLVTHYEGKGFFVASPDAQVCIECGYIVWKILKLGLQRHKHMSTSIFTRKTENDPFEQMLKTLCSASLLKGAKVCSHIILLRLCQQNRKWAIKAMRIFGIKVIQLLKRNEINRAEQLLHIGYKYLIRECQDQVSGEMESWIEDEIMMSFS